MHVLLRLYLDLEDEARVWHDAPCREAAAPVSVIRCAVELGNLDVKQEEASVQLSFASQVANRWKQIGTAAIALCLCAAPLALTQTATHLAQLHANDALVPALDDAARAHVEGERLLAGVLGGPELLLQVGVLAVACTQRVSAHTQRRKEMKRAPCGCC